MAGKRQHVVPRFLLQRFGRITDRGPRVCQLDVRTGANRQISPRDAEIEKRFYAIEVDGMSSTIADDALQVVEDLAAPLIADVVANETPLTELHRIEVATFLAAARTRTPVSRLIKKSVVERAETWRLTDHALAQMADRANDDERVPDVDADEFAKALRTGDISLEAPKEMLVSLAMRSMQSMSFLFFLFDWTLVKTESAAFILPDAAVGSRDPTPKVPETGAAPMSSLNSQTFFPLDPSAGLLLSPSQSTFDFARQHHEAMQRNLPEEVLPLIAAAEGDWSVESIDADAVGDLNLLSYAHAHEFIYGSQTAVTLAHNDARRRRREFLQLRPKPPRLHILEDHPTESGTLIETDTIVGVDPRHRRGR